MDQSPSSESSSKVQEVKLKSPEIESDSFFKDFKLFLVENSNLVIGVSIGTLLVVFGLFFGLTSNQAAENENNLQEIAELATGALVPDSEPASVPGADFSAPPSISLRADVENNNTTNSGEEINNNTNINQPNTANNSNPTVELGRPEISIPPASNDLNVNSADSLSSQNPSANPFGSSSFGGQQPSNVGNLSSQVPNPGVSLGQNPNFSNNNGFLSNTQAQVMNSNFVQGNTGPELYIAAILSFLIAASIRRFSKKRI